MLEEDKGQFKEKCVQLSGRIGKYGSSMLDGIVLDLESEDGSSETTVTLANEQPWGTVPANSKVTVRGLGHWNSGKLENAAIVNHEPPAVVLETPADIANRLASDGIQKAFHEYYKLRQFHLRGTLASLSQDFAETGRCEIRDDEHVLEIQVNEYDINRMEKIDVGDDVEFIGSVGFAIGQSTPSVSDAILVSPQPAVPEAPWLTLVTDTDGTVSRSILTFTADSLGAWSRREPRALEKLIGQYEATYLVEVQVEIDAVLPSDLDEDEAYLRLKNSPGADIRAVIERTAMGNYEAGQRVAIAAEELGVSGARHYIWLTGLSSPLGPTARRGPSRIIHLDND